MKYHINQANIKDWARDYDGELFDAILCDPPYELGFMGKSWDSSGIAFDKDMWADLFKLLKPGGHLLAFSGSRTYHRMAVAIEDAGFEIRDMIEWVYGSGFPKSLNIGKRGVGGYEGYGTALKPAHEPCVLARKPLIGTVAANVLKHGTGGLNIDGTRVGTEQVEQGREGRQIADSTSYHNGLQPTERTIATGRFPANLIHDGSDEVVGLFPQTGKGNGGKPFNYGGREYENKDTSMFNGDRPQAPSNRNDSGSAARFFYTAKASKSERNAGLEGFEPKREADRVRDDGVGGDNPRNRTNNAKANHHPTVKPLSLTKYLATLIKPPTGGRLLVPFSGSGSEMIGALQAGWEYVEGVELTEEYIPIAEARIKHWLDKMSKEQLEML